MSKFVTRVVMKSGLAKTLKSCSPMSKLLPFLKTMTHRRFTVQGVPYLCNGFLSNMPNFHKFAVYTVFQFGPRM
jgi:hypothetical protein